MRTAFLDGSAGLAGDMVLGALVDTGLDLQVLRDVVAALDLPNVTVGAEQVMRGPLRATKVEVLVDGEPADGVPGSSPPEHRTHGHRTFEDIRARIAAASELPQAARDDATRVFRVLAEAEARVHGQTVEEVHFHEVGANDAMVDIVGTCVGLRHLGVTDVRVGPLPWSEGEVDTAHGRLPLPAPATLLLFEGLATFPSRAGYEQVTPTGAALARALVSGHAVPAGFVVETVGTGAGSFDAPERPNVVRLAIGRRTEEATPTDALLLEANLDDATGQEVARAMEAVLAAGALDVWSVPVVMKKGRPGQVLSVLAAPADVARMEAILFAETPTLGVRRRAVARTVLARRHVVVTTAWGDVRMKVRALPHGEEATPEYDDCRRLADAHDVSLRRVLLAARQAYAELEG